MRPYKGGRPVLCPQCNHTDDRVLESRQNSSGSMVRRRRECTNCGYRFTSYERIEEKPLMVVKRDHRIEPFDIRKIERGIQITTEKRHIRPEVLEKMIEQIEDEIMIKSSSKREIPSTTIGEIALTYLYKVDAVAYVRFASVYRAFDSVEKFIEEIEKIREGL